MLYPVPIAGGASYFTATSPEAVQHQRQRVYEFARGWVGNFPGSADALQALAVSLELLGDRSALDTLMKARRLAVDPGDKVRIASAEMWMRVLFGVPGQPAELRLAKQLADSILANGRVDAPAEPELLWSVAALTGRAHLAASLGRKIPKDRGWDTPPALTGIGISYLTYAAMGGPKDSLRALERRVTDAIAQDVMPSEQDQARMQWLVLPATLEFPEYRSLLIRGLAGGGNLLIDADVAYLTNDTVRARALVAQLWADSRKKAPADLTIDQLYPGAWLMATLGQPDAAVRWMDPTMTTLARMPPQQFSETFRAGMLVRAMAFRADLAARNGDRNSAQEWATAVVVLWADADAFLQPLVSRMKNVAR